MKYGGWVAIPREVLSRTANGELSNNQQLVLLTLTLWADADTGSGETNAPALRASLLPDLSLDNAKEILSSLQQKGYIYRQIKPFDKHVYRYWVHGYQVSKGKHASLFTDISKVLHTKDVRDLRYSQAPPDPPLERPLDPPPQTPPDPPLETPPQTPLDPPHNNNKDKDQEKDKKKDKDLIPKSGERYSDNFGDLNGETDSDERSETNSDPRGERKSEGNGDSDGDTNGDTNGDKLSPPLPLGMVFRDGAYFIDDHPIPLEAAQRYIALAEEEQ